MTSSEFEDLQQLCFPQEDLAGRAPSSYRGKSAGSRKSSTGQRRQSVDLRSKPRAVRTPSEQLGASTVLNGLQLELEQMQLQKCLLSQAQAQLQQQQQQQQQHQPLRRPSLSQSFADAGSLRGTVGQAAPNFHSLGLRKMGLQPTRNIVELPVPPAAAAGVSALAGNSLTLDGELMKFIMPSGPRKNGEGVEDLRQGILSTVVVNESAILVQITLLVAGFVIGPSGESVRSIIAKTGASIYSYTEVVENKKSRLFYIEGPVQSVITALQIVWASVARYKQLAEGEFSGHQVERKQNLCGVDFTYQPPPRSVVPYAAGLTISKEAGKTYAIASNSQLLCSRYDCI